MAQHPAQESFFFVGSASSALRPPFSARAVARLAAEGIFLGTSSWKYRGWEGMIYAGGYESEAQFQRTSLREYTHYFPAVGADFTFFAYPTPDMAAYLVNSSPENFRFCSKATKRITVARFPDLPVYGKWAGKENPEFLDPGVFNEMFQNPLQALGSRLGPVTFEFSQWEHGHLPRLESFFAARPKDQVWAVELRDPSALGPEFYRTLVQWGLVPALRISSRYPPILEQWDQYLRAGGGEQTLPVMLLADQHPELSVEEATRAFQPYSRLVREDPAGRRALAAITEFARQNKRRAFILFHNRWEGSAPWSVGRFMAELAEV